MHFDIPANNWRSGIKASWYQGGAMPENPPGSSVDLRRIDHGALFEGSRGSIVAGFESRMILPGRGADMTYYKPRTKENLLPPVGDFQRQWINACKGNGKTCCDFDYGGKMIEAMLLGLVAYRVGKKFKYDGAAGKVTDCPAANELLSRKYRAGWTLDG
jgi:hypothetical protein